MLDLRFHGFDYFGDIKNPRVGFFPLVENEEAKKLHKVSDLLINDFIEEGLIQKDNLKAYNIKETSTPGMFD